MILPLLLIAAQAAPATKPLPPAPAKSAAPTASLQEKFDGCVELAGRDPRAGAAAAGRWRLAGGGTLAQQCLGMSYANDSKWAAAAGEFEGSAKLAEVAKDRRASLYWAQAGNAWLAAKDANKARAALDAALATGTLTGLDRGEALLDRARAQVAANEPGGARVDIDAALIDAKADPLAWLLSATLARRMDDLPRARTDIAEALRLSPEDGSVQLEAGNIAALAGDEAGAKAAWRQAATLAPASDTGKRAQAALAQFDAAKP